MTKENKRLRGDSGGISVAYNSATRINISNPYLRVKNCTIRQNTAYFGLYEAEVQSAVYRTVENYTYSGRGGGLAIVMNEQNYNMTIVIDNCTFAENRASYGGGGVYVNLGGQNTSHTITLSKILFDGNSAGDIGGGTHTVFNNGFTTSQVTITDCRYKGNKAIYGGGISTIRLYGVGLVGNRFDLTNTVFESNHAEEAGSAVIFFSYQYPFNAVMPFPYVVRNWYGPHCIHDTHLPHNTHLHHDFLVT